MPKKAKQIVVTTKKGKQVRLLNPAQKGAKAAVELKRGVKMTNFGKVKTKKDGTPRALTKTERAYRAGYLDARNDNAKAYKHNKAKRAKNKKK